MNNLFKIFIIPIKTIFFLILLPFKIIHFVLTMFVDGLAFIWDRFLSLFRFSLSFKVSVFYFLTIGISFLLIISSVLYGYKLYLTHYIPQWQSQDYLRTENYLEHNDTINPDELKSLYSQENIIFIRRGNTVIFEHNPKEIFESSEDFSQVDPMNIRLLAEPMQGSYGPYNFEIKPYIQNYQAITIIVFIAFFFIAFLALIIITFLGSKINHRMFKPIIAMTNSAKKITGNSLNERIDVANSYDELKDLGETFNKMMDRIENSYRKQKQFVNDASHELRTPIAVIQGYSNLLDRWGKDDEKILLESIEAIKDESEHMKHLVNSLLFLARADKNETKLEKKTFLINDLLEELIKENRLIDSSHAFEKTIEGNLLIHADRNLIKQALRIFIQNSIKFTEEGGKITLKAFSRENNIVIDICDTGIGIPKKDLKNIFDRFYRADESRSKNKGGTGLGLSIARLIIRSHKGRILIRSKVDVGTDIRLILPYKVKESTNETTKNHKKQQEKTQSTD